MNKTLKIIFVTTVLTLFASNSYSARDCSAFTHKIDIKICEARNLEDANKTVSTGSNNSGKVKGFFNKISNKLNLKDNKKFREVGDK